MSQRSPGIKTPDFIKKFATDQYAKKGTASFEQHPTGAQQLELFQHFKSTSPLQDAETPNNTSNLVEIYDLLPKGIAYGSVSTTPSTIEKVITIDGRSVITVLTPAAIARIVKGKKVIEFHYPTNKEDLISEVVRFIVLRNKSFSYSESENEYQHQITIHQIYNMLKELEVSMSHAQIRKSLEIMNKANLEVWSMDRTEKISGTLLPTFVSKEKGSGKGRKTKEEALMLISFHPLYTMGIQNSNYRPYDYMISSRIKNSVGKYIFKKMSIYFKNAGKDRSTGHEHRFVIDVEEAITNSLVVAGKTISEDKKKVVKALQELRKLNIVGEFTPHDRVGGAKRITHSEFSMTGGDRFIQSMIIANQTQQARAGKRSMLIIKGLTSQKTE